MTEDEVRQRAFAMPLHNPAFPPGPYRFVSAQDDAVTLAAFDDYFDGKPNNAGIVLKVVPDDTMRGLELA